MPQTPRILQAGPLRLLYEPDRGWIRRIRWGGREILRAIYPAVRDRNWDTVPGTFTAIRHEVRHDAFTLEFEAHHLRDDIDFAWHGRVEGGIDGQLRYIFEGEARATFLRNRIGLCVLHPLRECVGTGAVQTRTDGQRIPSSFPDLIEPQIVGEAGFRDLRAVAHEVAPGTWAEVHFDGDVFEMEDQRNWTDASFKTYGTPLALPFPAPITAGTRVRQEVTLRLLGPQPPHDSHTVESGTPPSAGVQVRPEPGEAFPLPRIGTVLPGGGNPPTREHAERLRALGLSHLRVDLHLADPRWPEAWERAVHQAALTHLHLELALHLPRNGVPDEDFIRRQLLRPGAPGVDRVLALRTGEPATSPRTLETVRKLLRDWNTPVGAGSDGHFCELNREQALGRCAIADADFIFWPVTPQVHATDDLSIMENLEALAATVRSARAFAGDRPLVVGPVTLRPRLNAVSTHPSDPMDSGATARPTNTPGDPRQTTGFGAAWALGSLAELARARVASLTAFEAFGPAGLMPTQPDIDPRSLSPANQGGVFPIYRILAALGPTAGAEVLPLLSSDPRAVAALAVRHGPRATLLLANLRPEPQSVTVAAFPGVTPTASGPVDTEWIGTVSAKPLPRVLDPGHLIELPAYTVLRWTQAG
jgi:hypothetical protein